MISNSVLVFVLLGAGAAMGKSLSSTSELLAGVNSASSTGSGGLSNWYSKGESRQPSCNDCLKTVVKIIKKAQDANENGDDFFDQIDPCSDFSFQYYQICSNVIDYIQESGTLNIMKARKFCARADYCPSKYDPLKDYPKNNPSASWQRKPQSNGIRCTGDNTESDNLNDNDTDSSDTDSDNSIPPTTSPNTCRDCEKVIRAFSKAVNSQEDYSGNPNRVCSAFKGLLRKYCHRQLSQNSDLILDMSLNRKSPREICAALNQCPFPVTYPICRACRIYVGNIKQGSFISENRACSYLHRPDRGNCVRVLRTKKREVIRLVNDVDMNTGVCMKIGLCPPFVRVKSKGRGRGPRWSTTPRNYYN